MLFEPSGVLRCDYGAYCNALGLVEREELYRSIFTDEERRVEEEAKYRETHLSVRGTQAADPPASSPPEQCNTSSAAVVGSRGGVTQRSTSRHGVSAASVRSKKKSCLIADSVKEFVVAAPPTITFIAMRNLKFCLNQRDMKPLALAIPHCLSLVSVELVGCGLSEESYVMLVEALYRSRRVTSVTVDFNNSACPGFYVDPTIPFAKSLTPISSAATTSFHDAQQDLSLTNLVAETVGGCTRQSTAVQSQTFTRTSGDSMPLKKCAGGDVITLAPSGYRGLKDALLAVDPHSREEKGRRGKADFKRQTQLQQQLDQLAHIDMEKPVCVPRGWFSMVVTGVKHLSLRGNGITDENTLALASLLASHPRSELVSLNLWGNCIGDDGAVALAQLLKENRTLQVLDLGNNKIGDVGLLKLVDCFRMQEVSFEKLQAYRKRHLTRRDATARERQLATTLPPPYPAYQELYTAWYQSKHPQATEDKKESKKGAQAKVKKVESVLTRPSTPFDCECFRVENAVRVPGNTVLRCVNLGNNKRITVDGAREALRVLSLREPSKDDEMIALQNSSFEPPEFYCAAISLRTFVFLHSGEPELLEVQKRLSDVLYERLQRLELPSLGCEVLGDDAKKRPTRNKK